MPKMSPSSLYASLLLFALPALATVIGPVIDTNFADPSVLKVGNTLYAYSTNFNNMNTPWAKSTDGGHTWSRGSSDALPDVGSWAMAGKGTWDPDVIDRGDGTYILYYAANSPSQKTHCVGAATSTSPTGPFKPGSSPIACNTKQGGSIGVSGFQDTDGTRYVVYKVDGNSLGGGGGACHNADGRHPTPILLQKMSSDGLTPVGNATQILDRSAEDGAYVEAPDIALVNGVYFLFHSSHCFLTPDYDIRYATASKITGPYTKNPTPLKKSGDNGLSGPGSLSVLPGNASFAVFHAANTSSTPSSGLHPRPMYIAEIKYNGTLASA